MEAVTTVPAARWLERVTRRPVLVVLTVVAVLAAPYLITGPEIMADDWVWIRNGEFIAWWDAGGSRQAGRPGAFVLYAITFGLIGAHPLVLALVQVGLWAAAAVSVLRCLRAFIDHDLALLVTVLWLVVPSHTTLELWASTSQAWVALILLAEGLRLARVAPDRRWLAYVLLALCGTFYEVVMPVVPVGLAIVDRLRTGRFRWQPLAVGAALVAPALVWSLTASTIYPDTVEGTEHEVIEHFGASLAFGIPVQSPLAYALVAVAAVVLFAAVRTLQRTGWTQDLAMEIGGFAVLAAGTAFALRSYLLPQGIGNRVTVVSGVGAALFWVGAFRQAAIAQPMTRRIAAAGVLVVVIVATRLMYLVDWIETADRGAREASSIAAEVAADGDAHLILAERPAVGDWTYALLDGWNTTAAVQVITGDRTLVVNATRGGGCVITGPPPDQPLAQYGTVEERVLPECRADRPADG